MEILTKDYQALYNYTVFRFYQVYQDHTSRLKNLKFNWSTFEKIAKQMYVNRSVEIDTTFHAINPKDHTSVIDHYEGLLYSGLYNLVDSDIEDNNVKIYLYLDRLNFHPELINGLSGSYAAKDDHNNWYVHGAPDVLDEQENAELAYKINADFDEVKLLPKDTPIYAGVHAFDDLENDFDKCYDFLDVNDVYAVAKEILRNLDQSGFAEYNDKYILKTNVENDQQALDRIAESLFDQVTWQSFESYSMDLTDDICDVPDAYPELFINKEKE